MIHKKLLVALFSIMLPSIVMSDASLSDAPYSTDVENSTWSDGKTQFNPSFGYFKIGLGNANNYGQYESLSSKNNQAEFLDNNKTLENPNYEDGMVLETDSTESRAGSLLASFEFGYNAALGQTRATLGFYAGLNLMTGSRTIPVTLSLYDVDLTNPADQTAWIEDTVGYETTLKTNLSFNAGLIVGMRVTDRTFAFLKGGWTCARVSSTKLNENDVPEDGNKDKKNTGFLPTYMNGFMYGGGIDFMITERVSVGLEAFGTIYADKEVTLFNLESPAINQGVVNVPSSSQSLIADPLSLSSWGIMATVKLNFMER